MSAPRVYIAGLFHEAHSFSALPSGEHSFAVVSGAALLGKARASAAGLGGAVRALESAGATLIPGLSAVAAPGGRVPDSLYQGFKAAILDGMAAARPDAVFLDLHGAMQTESLDDPEGDLLAAVRALVGPSVPIATALDLHAHPTPLMFESALCLACKENPHTDYAEAGARAARLLLSAWRGEISPSAVAVWLPLVIGARLETGSGPLHQVHALRRAREESTPAILDISVFNTTAYLDAPGAGQCVSAIVDAAVADAHLGACGVVREIAEHLWRRRDDFLAGGRSLDQVLRDALADESAARPLVVGDWGDRVLAGTPGDGTWVMTALRERWPGLRALVPVTDPSAVERARLAGVGGAFHGPLGGGFSAEVEPCVETWRVARLGDGDFVQRGPYLAGEPASLGPTAVLTAGNLTALATSRPGLTQDPNAFESNGLDLRGFDVVVSKSGFHFAISFEGIGTCAVADTPGPSNYRPGALAYRRRRPVYPEDAIDAPDLVPRLFPCRVTAEPEEPR